jgi:hypothetical protein
VRERWRARTLDEGLTAAQRNYAHARVQSLGKPYANRLQVCEQFGSTFACGCPGSKKKRWFTCRQHLMCPRCARRRGLTQKNRIRRSLLDKFERMKLDIHLEVADQCDCAELCDCPAAGQLGAHAESCPAWGCRGRGNGDTKPLAVLLTHTLRDTGDVAHDLSALERGWRAFYKRYHAAFGRFPYVGVDEVTAGTRGIGHVHKHVVVLWPFRCWNMLQRWWRAACPESARINMRAAYSVRGAARYLAKYTAKGIDTSEWTPQLRARVVCAYYNKKLVQTSVGFWLKFTPLCLKCGQRHRAVVELDEWKQAVAWTSHAERFRERVSAVRAQAPPQEPHAGHGTRQLALEV